MIAKALHAIYSDDIRYEIGGKQSFIGVYSSEMWVQSFPALLPKLCISVSVRLPADYSTDSLKLRIFKDEQVIYEAELVTTPLNEVNPDFHREQAALGKESYNGVQSNVVFSPFTIEDACMIRVRVLTGDGEELKTGALQIRLAPENVDL